MHVGMLCITFDSQVRYFQLCDYNVTHVIYVIPLKYFKNSAVILIHAQRKLYIGTSKYPMIIALAMITHA